MRVCVSWNITLNDVIKCLLFSSYLLIIKARPVCRIHLKAQFISTLRLIVRTNPSQKRCFSIKLSKPDEFENASFAFSFGLSRKHFESETFKTMTKFFLIQISNNRLLLSFKIISASVNETPLLRF